MKEFANRLKLYQIQNCLTQGQLAERAGVTQGTMSAYMRDAKNPTLDMLATIARNLGVSIGWLCGEDDKLYLFYDFIEATAMLDDAEIGRLMKSIVKYARGDKSFDSELFGNERFIFPMFKLQIDKKCKESIYEPFI